MAEFKITTETKGEVTVVRTLGYLDDEGGKQVKEFCEQLLEAGKNRFVLNLAGTPVINSTGLSMVLDIVVKTIDYHDGKVAVTGLTKLTRTALQMTGVLTLCPAFETEQESIEAVSE
ncbi:MAG TPA: STAS domain-containing protein [Candidatus Ozemobacteraceae bacterium]|nr:STAS domain-containing protein [Candidatus Ozemobacteraceae bacterium]